MRGGRIYSGIPEENVMKTMCYEADARNIRSRAGIKKMQRVAATTLPVGQKSVMHALSAAEGSKVGTPIFLPFVEMSDSFIEKVFCGIGGALAMELIIYRFPAYHDSCASRAYLRWLN